jgi:hypothetical protein
MNANTLTIYGAVALVSWFASHEVSAQGNTPRRLPPPAEAIITRMEAEIAASKLRAVTSLEKVLRDTTKKGDLEAAVAIKAEMERLKAEADSAKAGAATSFVGKWKASDSAITFDAYPDGRVVNEGGVNGRWSVDGALIEVQWGNGVRVVLRPSGTGFVGERTMANGSTTAVMYSRVGAP